MKTKHKLTQEDLINIWMKKIFNTTIQEEVEKNPDKFKKFSNWYKDYQVTQQQHDEWEIEAKEVFRKYLKLSKKLVDRYWGLTYLNTSPTIQKDNLC